MGRLEPFEQADAYPVFKDPETGLIPGTSLCRLGFPLYQVTPEFDEETSSFILPRESWPPPLFPIEGIYTRNVLADPGDDKKLPVAFLETSSPGLRGQSGGPIFDTQGTVFSIQSQTAHHELGFEPRAGKHVEHQFLSVGIGAHPMSLVPFLRQCGVQFQMSEY